jgi:hypothetical protein
MMYDVAADSWKISVSCRCRRKASVLGRVDSDYRDRHGPSGGQVVPAFLAGESACMLGREERRARDAAGACGRADGELQFRRGRGE